MIRYTVQKQKRAALMQPGLPEQFTIVSAPSNLNIFNQKIHETHFDSEKMIIETFYTTACEWSEQREENTLNMATLKTLWIYYTLNLPQNKKEQAQHLANLITHQEQIVPKAFTYLEVLKVVFLMMLPDLLAEKYLDVSLRGQRDDDLFGLITVTENKKASTYLLIADQNANPQYFETFVARNEIQRGTESILKKFEDHFNQADHLDRYTQQDFSLMLLNEALPLINTLLDEPIVHKAIEIGVLDLNRYIGLMHDIIGWSISTYLQEKQTPTQIFAAATDENVEYNPTPISFDNHFIQRHFQEKNQQQTARATSRQHNKCIHALTAECYSSAASLIANTIIDYVQRVRLNISLGMTPAITETESILQELVYPVHCQSRTTLLENDEYGHTGARAQLGLADKESYERFICDNFTFADAAFHFPEPIKNFNEKQILDHLFIASADFLRRVDSLRCDPIIFDIIMNRLWHAFTHDPRCQESPYLSYRINVPRENATLITLRDIFHSTGLAQDVFLRLSLLIEWVTQKNILLLPIITQSILNHSKTQPNIDSTLEEKYIILHLLEKINSLSAPTEILLAMSMLLKSDYLSARNRFCLIGIIAENIKSIFENNKTNLFLEKLKNLASLLDDQVAIDEKVQLAIGETTAKHIAVISADTQLSTLTDRYSRIEPQNYLTTMLAQHIEMHCSRAQLMTLKIYLEQFSTLRKTSVMFSKLIGAENIQTVIKKIDAKEPAAEILLTLKNATNSRLRALSRNQDPIPLYYVIDAFFSINSVEINNKTMSDLLQNIQKVLPRNCFLPLLAR